MRFSQPVHMAEDAGPSWARRTSGRRKRGLNLGPLIGFIATILALFGALTTVMSIKEGSIASGGAVIDGWIDEGVAFVREAAGQAPAKVEEAADVAGDKAEAAADRTGAALKAGAEKTAEEFRSK